MAYGGLGIALPEQMNGVQAAQAAGSTSPALPPAPLPAIQPTLPAAPPPQQNDGGLPSWEGNPLGRIGFILSSAAAGLQGRELPIVEVRRQQAAQRQQALQTLSATMTLSEHLNEMDPSTANQFLAANQQTLADAGIPLDALKQASTASPEMRANAELLVNGPETYATLASLAGSNDPRKVLKFAETDIGKQIIGSAASDSVLGKHKAFMSALEDGGHGEDLRSAMADKVLTPEEYVHLASLFPKDSPFYTNLAERNQILTNKGLQQSLGITPTDMAEFKTKADYQNSLAQGNLRLEASLRPKPQGPEKYGPEQTDSDGNKFQMNLTTGKKEYNVKTSTGQQEYVNIQDQAGHVQSYIKGSPEAMAAVKQPGSRIVTNTLTGASVPEAQMRARSELSIVTPEIDNLQKVWPALSDTASQIKSALPGGNIVQSAEYQQARSAVETIVASSLYVRSGATANPGEVKKQVDLLMPEIGDKPAQIADKLRRIQVYVNAIKIAANTGAPAEAAAPPAAAASGGLPPPPAGFH